MNKKGFSLIELLSVIILLSVIALISTPGVLNVVELSKEKSRIQSVRGYADGVKLSYAEELINNTGNYCYINGNVYDNEKEECNNVYTIIFSDNIPYNTPIITVLNKTPNETEYATSKEIKVEYPSLKIVEEHYYIKNK